MGVRLNRDFTVGNHEKEKGVIGVRERGMGSVKSDGCWGIMSKIERERGKKEE